jgi:HSP20 family protein
MRHQYLMTEMLAQAVGMLDRAQQLERQFFRIGGTNDVPCWEPPVDMYEDNGILGVLVALPGVAPDRYQVTLEDAVIIVQGVRPLGAGQSSGTIVRLEIPYGRFERHIKLPLGNYRMVNMQLENGCLRLHLERFK